MWWLSGVLLVSCVALSTLAKPVEEGKLELGMPGVQPQKPDKYLCQPFKMAEEALYITGFVPHANMSTAHHMLLYGCAEPGDQSETWDCGEMLSTEKDKQFKSAPVCKSGAKIIYAWAMDAPALKLPKDVAFKVGDDTGINWLVLQVHYKDVSQFVAPNHGKDHSEITLITSTIPKPKRAGVFLMGTGGELAPESTVYMETACEVTDPLTIHPFAYRTHAHTHGEVNVGYRIRDGKWSEIGRQSPHKPQMFYNVTDPSIDVHQGDVLAARCTMVNNDTEPVLIGSTQKDEMCNFYIMYWVEGDKILNNNYCFSPGPPSWDWSKFSGLDVDSVPDSASLVPGATQVLQKTAQAMVNTAENLQDDLIEWLKKMEYEQEMEDSMAYDNIFYPEEDEQQQEYYGEYPTFERQSRGGGGNYPAEDSDQLMRQIAEFYQDVE